MKYLKTIESLEDKEKFERKPRVEKGPVNKCIGQCDRKVVVKDDKPSIYCSGCNRYIKSL